MKKLLLFLICLGTARAHAISINWEEDTINGFRAILSDSENPSRSNIEINSPSGFWDLGGHITCLDAAPYNYPGKVIMGFKWNLLSSITGDTNSFSELRDKTEPQLIVGEHWEYLSEPFNGTDFFEIVSRPNIDDVSTWGWEAIVQGFRPEPVATPDLGGTGMYLALASGFLVFFRRYVKA